MDFNVIKTAVARQFERMQRHPMFRVDVDRDQLWATYLTSFPEGSNPVYRERTEHDCSCCRQFVRAVGDVVAVVDGELVSVWDVQVPGGSAYEAVAAALSELVLSRPIAGSFLHHEPVAGIDRNHEQLFALDDPKTAAGVKTWTHFYVNIDRRFIKPKADISTLLGDRRSAHDVFLRSLREITDDAVETVLDLVAQNSLYRGEEHRPAVLQFREAKRAFDALPDDRAREIYAWAADPSGAVARIRNTVIGSLLTDLSEGVDLEAAVRSFEAKVAPINYKRPSALITPAMIAKAREKLEELGLTSALDRRFARLSDITINNVLFADRTTRRALTGDVFDELAAAAPATVKNLDKMEEVPVDRFLADILPRAEAVEVMFENRHAGNLVSLIAPSDPTARHLFKWANNFSWSYVGEVADAIKERVKAAGGNVTGDLCCRLAWSNYDDLDLHLVEPNRHEIYYASRRSEVTGGMLDVDMNITPTTRTPVENIFYSDRTRMREGEYHLFVHSFTARDKSDPGFECQIDFLGTVYQFAYPTAVRQGERVTVAKFRYTHKGGLEILSSLPSTQATRALWNLPTQTFHRVSAVMLSPNCWDDRAVGNRHYLFMIDGCRNDGTARGFFNEFLKEELNPHRKVFEAVAAKMKPADSPEQLSGLGFSSTSRNTVVCRVSGSFNRLVKVVF